MAMRNHALGVTVTGDLRGIGLKNKFPINEDVIEGIREKVGYRDVPKYNRVLKTYTNSNIKNSFIKKPYLVLKKFPSLPPILTKSAT